MTDLTVNEITPREVAKVAVCVCGELVVWWEAVRAWRQMPPGPKVEIGIVRTYRVEAPVAGLVVLIRDGEGIDGEFIPDEEGGRR